MNNSIELVNLDENFLIENFGKSEDDWYSVYLVDYMKNPDEWSKDGDQWSYNASVFASYEDAEKFYKSIQQESLQSYISELAVSVEDDDVSIGLDALCNGDYFRSEEEFKGSDPADNSTELVNLNGYFLREKFGKISSDD